MSPQDAHAVVVAVQTLAAAANSLVALVLLGVAVREPLAERIKDVGHHPKQEPPK